MSGICGLFNLDEAPVAEPDLRSMTAMLEQRGPERTGRWREGFVGIGHTLLATTPELQFEKQPQVHAETGCVITADVRLDNREELGAALELARPLAETGDAELILLAYLASGEHCVDRLLGDFAFAIWDPRNRVMFCARDQFGMRPFYYYHVSSQRFVFASDARAILVLPQVPHQINEDRIADFLVPEFEWYDYESSFFDGVHRLPPGHKAVVTPSGLTVSEYYRVQPGPDPGPMTDNEYREGFVEVFSRAIDARLRGPAGTVGSMLSGGMDSGSVVAFAKGLQEQHGLGPLPTFSGVNRLDNQEAEDARWSETQSIHNAITMTSITPTLVHPDETGDLFEPLSSGFEEPFDGVFTILKALFVTAHGQGIRTLLDGGGGDVAMHEGSYIIRLLRSGRLHLAVSEIVAESKYWGHSKPLPALLRYARNAVLPDVIKRAARAHRNTALVRNYLDRSLIAPEFAGRVGMQERHEQMLTIFPRRWNPDYAQEFCDRIRPNMTGGKERYSRIAASTGMEARDPYLDKRVVEYCSRLPGRFKLRDGWPKVILRDVTAGLLPDAVRWTRRKEHLSWWFADSVTRLAAERGTLTLAVLEQHLARYVDIGALHRAWQEFEAGGDSGPVHHAWVLATWIEENATRPVVPG
jgi:asparagine synthase (glutamine-hydrolysing)